MEYLNFICTRAHNELKQPDFQLLTFVNIPEFEPDMVFITISGQVFKGSVLNIRKQITDKICQKLSHTLQSQTIPLLNTPPSHTSVHTINTYLSQTNWPRALEDKVHLWIWRYCVETETSQSSQSRQKGT